MKISKISILFLSFFLIFATPDEENITLEVERIEDNSVSIIWSINYEEFDSILLNFTSGDFTETYDLPFKEGAIELCCYEDEVEVELIVLITKAVEVTGDSCDAVECFEFVKEEFSNLKQLPKVNTLPTTTLPTTTTTTTTTIPKPVEEDTFLNIEITNELITNIPLFEDVDLTDIEKNNIAIALTTGIIILFYIVLLLQEWFNKIISQNRIKIFSKDKDFRSNSKIKNFTLILIALTVTSLLIGYVEEGASLEFDLQNLAVFIAAFIGLSAVTLFYEGTEGFLEKIVFKQEIKFRWAPQAMFFALLSTLSFIYFNMPIGFIFGFVASSYILSDREIARLSPKFYSSIFLSGVGFLFFYLTSVDQVKSSTVLTAIAAISYLMCLEGVLFKSLPGGGNELLESIRDSKGIFKTLPLLAFALGLWLFVRILIVQPDSEFSTFQQDLLGMGSFAITFAIMLGVYIGVLIVVGLGIKAYGKVD